MQYKQAGIACHRLALMQALRHVVFEMLLFIGQVVDIVENQFETDLAIRLEMDS